VLEDGTIRLLSRTLANAEYNAETLAAVGERTRDLLTTLVHNVTDPTHARFERTVASVTLDPHELPRIRRDIVAQGEAFLSAASDLLHWPGANVAAGEEPKVASRVGVTVFVFEEPVVVPPRKLSKAKSGKPKSPLRAAQRGGSGGS